MELRINYGCGTVILPDSCLLQSDPLKLAVLVKLCGIYKGPDVGYPSLDELCSGWAAEFGVAPADIKAAVEFWNDNGAVSIKRPAASEDAYIPPQPPKEKVIAPDRRATYSGEEMANVIENTEGLSAVIDECQNLLSRVFSPTEVMTLISMSDYLKLTNDYILTLVNYCINETSSKKDRIGMRYIERTAYNLYDEGIYTTEALEMMIKQRADAADAEKRFRRKLGIDGREATKKEKSYFKTWFEEWAFPYDVAEQAYEVTIDGTRNHQMSYEYMNKVLKNWHDAGYQTLDEVTRALERYKSEKEQAAESKAADKRSFDTDEFFELALKRSYEKIENSRNDSGKNS